MENKHIKQTKSAGGIVINKDGDILVVNQNGTTWSLPKCHVEKGENDLDTAKRETYEESGIKDLEIVKSLGEYQRFKLAKDGSENKSELKSIKFYLFKTSEKNIKPIDSENPEARWVEKNKVLNLLTHPKDKEFF